MSAMKRSPVSLNNDLKILSRYDLVRITKEKPPGHGVYKVIESSLGNEKIESLRVLFPAPWGEKKMNKVPVEYPAFERNEKSSVKREGLPRGFLFSC
jgi:hypothetical protein